MVKRAGLVALCCCALMSVAMRGTTGSGNSEDLTTVTPGQVDFGDVLAGAKLTQVVTVENDGSVPLEVERLRTSCGCTAAVASGRDLAPGGSVEIEVKMSAFGQPGSVISKSVTVQLAGGQALKIPVRARICSDFSATTRVVVGEQRTLRLEAAGGESFRVLGSSPSIAGLSSLAASPSHAIVVSEAEWEKAGSPQAVRLQLDHPRVSSLTVGLSSGAVSVPPGGGETAAGQTDRRTAPSARVVPRRIAFPVLDGEGSVARIVVVGGGAEEPVIRCRAEGLAAEIVAAERTAEGWAIDVRVIGDGIGVGRHRVPLEVVLGDEIAPAIAHVVVRESEQVSGEDQ